jgi:hypothetical protein
MIIYPGLIKSDFLITVNDHSFRIWLWETQDDMRRWAERYSLGDEKPGYFDDAAAIFSPSDCMIHEPCSHLGELHFVKDYWDEELVAHELTHAQFQYIRKQVEDFVRPLYQFYRGWMAWEEDLCYPFGQWYRWVFRWLWKHNPNPKWVREKED